VHASRLRVAYPSIYLCACTNIQTESGLPIYLPMCLYKHPEWVWTTHLFTCVPIQKFRQSKLPIYLPVCLYTTSRMRVDYPSIYLCACTHIQTESGLPIYLPMCLYKHPDWERPAHLSNCVPVHTSRRRVAYQFIYLCSYTNIQIESGLPIHLPVCLYTHPDGEWPTDLLTYVPIQTSRMRVDYPSIYLCVCTQHSD